MKPFERSGFAPVEWSVVNDARDDFFGNTQEGYILRVEQMDRRAWWCQCYAPGGKALLEDSPCFTTRDQAFMAIEIIYKVHRNAKRQ